MELVIMRAEVKMVVPSRLFKVFFLLSFLSFAALGKSFIGIPLNISFLDPAMDETHGENPVSSSVEDMILEIKEKMECDQDVSILAMNSSCKVFGVMATHNYVYVNEDDLSGLSDDERLFIVARAIAHLKLKSYIKSYLTQSPFEGGRKILSLFALSFIPSVPDISLKFGGGLAKAFLDVTRIGLVDQVVGSIAKRVKKPVLNFTVIRLEKDADSLVLEYYPELQSVALKMFDKFDSSPHIDKLSKKFISERRVAILAENEQEESTDGAVKSKELAPGSLGRELLPSRFYRLVKAS